MFLGADQVVPPFVDSRNTTCGKAVVPLTYERTMRLVASTPVGEPLAMSTEGAVARSLRAPATPSSTDRPCTGSSTPGWVTAPGIWMGRPQFWPPSVEGTMYSKFSLVAGSVPMPKTYTLPRLSVRIVQPSSGWICVLLAAAVTCFCVQVLPPSVEVATINGAGVPRPFSWPLNEAQHTYAWPKNGLLDALSAQTCSLSLNVVDDCFESTTGGFQALLLPMVVAVTLSVRETAIASKPMKASSERIALKLLVRFA